MNDYLYEVAKRLVAFDTVSAKSDRDAIEYLAAELAPRGFKTAIQPIELFGVAQANLVAWIGPPRADGLIISGHVDVVPFDGQPGWEREPLKLELAGEQNLRPRHHRHERLHRAMPRRRAHARFVAAQAPAGVRLHRERGSRMPRRSQRRARAQANPGRNSSAAVGVDRRADFVGSVARAQEHRVVRRHRRAASAVTAARRPAASTRSP